MSNNLRSEKAKRSTAKKTKAVAMEEQKEQKDFIQVDIREIPEDELIFALDIGTRTVVGIVGVVNEGNFECIATEIIEHQNRAMLDGQIHDISQVAVVVSQVKENLENKLKITLKKVAIAAAGRALKTKKVKVERKVEQDKEIEQELINNLELEGIQKAQMELDGDLTEDEKTNFYCVGYSVINYYLNNYLITSLIGHRAKKIGVDVLATFLPYVVVDSLYSVMNKIGLEVINLTLEPIAAINVAIPKDLRLLNLALVDIGAGTSDIAITKDGTVIAYAMAPIAGDEISEKISEHYLLDFNTAEFVKKSLSQKKSTVSFVDILGKKHNIKNTELYNVVKPSVEFLAKTISDKILEINQKAPNAVFLIGGGSQIPGLSEFISQNLNLHKDRVAVKGRDIIKSVKYSSKDLSGPEAITPFGIAVSAQDKKNQDFLAVSVNGKNIRLLNSKKLNVADALIFIGVGAEQLIGRTGKSIEYQINGEKRIVKGQCGKASEIYVNDQLANLETLIQNGDRIKIIPCENGKNAVVKVLDITKNIENRQIIFNNKNIEIETKIYVNGRLVDKNYNLKNGDILCINEYESIKELLDYYEINESDFLFYVNGKEEDVKYKIQNLDDIKCISKKDVQVSDDLLDFESKKDDNTCIENLDIIQNNNISVSGVKTNSYSNELNLTVNGQNKIISTEKKSHIFVDVFNYIDFDLSKSQGGIVLKLNGKKAAFTDEIKSGDTIDIYWEKQM